MEQVVRRVPPVDEVQERPRRIPPPPDHDPCDTGPSLLSWSLAALQSFEDRDAVTRFLCQGEEQARGIWDAV